MAADGEKQMAIDTGFEVPLALAACSSLALPSVAHLIGGWLPSTTRWPTANVAV
jgi:hypothetical protein